MIQETLTKIGLNKEETEIYLALLEHGSIGASEISKYTSVKRTYVYKIAQGLIKKGIVTSKAKGKATVFSPNSPDHLLTLAEKQKEAAEESKNQLEGILHSLQQKYMSVEEKPVVRTYEGFEGLKKIYIDTLNVGQPIFAFLQNTDINPDFRGWLREHYLKERVSKQIKAKVIIASGEKAKMYIKEDKVNLRESVLVDSKDFPFEVEVNIYGSKVSFINYKNSTNPVGIIIDNAPIANTLKAFFDLNWKTLANSAK